MNKQTIAIIAILCIFVFWGYVSAASSNNSIVIDANRYPAKDGANCDISTVASVTVGSDLSSRIIATSSTRSFTRISVGNNATNTIFVTFNNDISATADNGIMLNGGNTNGASTTPYIDFGLTTQFPYIGSVTAVSSFASTTVLVTSCSY